MTSTSPDFVRKLQRALVRYEADDEDENQNTDEKTYTPREAWDKHVTVTPIGAGYYRIRLNFPEDHENTYQEKFSRKDELDSTLRHLNEFRGLSVKSENVIPYLEHVMDARVEGYESLSDLSRWLDDDDLFEIDQRGAITDEDERTELGLDSVPDEDAIRDELENRRGLDPDEFKYAIRYGLIPNPDDEGFDEFPSASGSVLNTDWGYLTRQRDGYWNQRDTLRDALDSARVRYRSLGDALDNLFDTEAITSTNNAIHRIDLGEGNRFIFVRGNDWDELRKEAHDEDVIYEPNSEEEYEAVFNRVRDLNSVNDLTDFDDLTLPELQELWANDHLNSDEYFNTYQRLGFSDPVHELIRNKFGDRDAHYESSRKALEQVFGPDSVTSHANGTDHEASFGKDRTVGITVPNSLPVAYLNFAEKGGFTTKSKSVRGESLGLVRKVRELATALHQNNVPIAYTPTDKRRANAYATALHAAGYTYKPQSFDTTAALWVPRTTESDEEHVQALSQYTDLVKTTGGLPERLNRRVIDRIRKRYAAGSRRSRRVLTTPTEAQQTRTQTRPVPRTDRVPVPDSLPSPTQLRIHLSLVRFRRHAHRQTATPSRSRSGS